MAKRSPIFIDQGTDFFTSITLADDNDDPIDLTEYSGRAMMRKHPSSNTAYSFDVSTNANGVVLMELSAEASAAIPAGRYQYDLELTADDGTISRIVEGIVTISARITR